MFLTPYCSALGTSESGSFSGFTACQCPARLLCSGGVCHAVPHICILTYVAISSQNILFLFSPVPAQLLLLPSSKQAPLLSCACLCDGDRWADGAVPQLLPQKEGSPPPGFLGPL